ncbi:MAG: DinB family protein, partial [Bacteroidetes bacterium]
MTLQSGATEVIPAILVVAMQVVGLGRSFDEEKWNTVPYRGSWTPAQLVRHLLKSVSSIGPLIETPAAPAERDPHERILSLKQNFLDITKRMQSPEFIVPEKMYYDKELLIREFETALAPLTKLKTV